MTEQSTQDREVEQLISEGYEVVARDDRKVTLRKVKQGNGRYSVSVVDVLADVVFRHRGQIFEGSVPEKLR